MRTLRAALLTVGLAALTHCGSSDPAPPAAFSCGTIRCMSGAEYCEDSAHPGGGHGYMCRTLPASCVGDPCSGCLTGIPGRVSCLNISVAGVQETTVVISQ